MMMLDFVSHVWPKKLGKYTYDYTFFVLFITL